jgi:hypothetical protein
MLWLFQCLDGESSSGESPVPQIRSIGQFFWVVCFLLLTVVFWGAGFRASSVIKTGEWSEDGPKHDFTTAKCWGVLFVTFKSTRSGSLFLSDGQYVGSPVDRRFKLCLSIVLNTRRPLGVINLNPQSVTIYSKFIFVNRILFAVCTSTFNKWCKRRIQWNVEKCLVTLLCN